MRITKLAANRGLDGDTETLLALESMTCNVAHQSQDAKEGVQAFLEKRDPVWKTLESGRAVSAVASRPLTPASSRAEPPGFLRGGSSRLDPWVAACFEWVRVLSQDPAERGSPSSYCGTWAACLRAGAAAAGRPPCRPQPPPPARRARPTRGPAGRPPHARPVIVFAGLGRGCGRLPSCEDAQRATPSSTRQLDQSNVIDSRREMCDYDGRPFRSPRRYAEARQWRADWRSRVLMRPSGARPALSTGRPAATGRGRRRAVRLDSTAALCSPDARP